MTQPLVHAARGTNKKLGMGMFVSTSSRNTCPDSCPLKNNGCYAENFPLRMHWDKVSSGSRGDSWESFLGSVKRLPRSELWRHNQAGDLAGDGDNLDIHKLDQLVAANHNRRGFTYTHKPLHRAEERAAVLRANANGFTVNVSAECLSQADSLMDEGFPVAVILPSNTTSKLTQTASGRKVLTCPAVTKGWTCQQCGLCYDAKRSYAIGFPSHGARKRTVDVIASAR